jgi:S-adenosylmethionine hydrolase
MAVITFMSDFGTDDHYVATVKAKIFSKNPNQQIVDISHTIKPFDISNAAMVLRSVYHEFPPGTVHLVSVDAIREKANAIAIELDGHFFIGFDCGLFSMISNSDPTSVVEAEIENTTFPAKDVLADMATELANGTALISLGKPKDQMTKLFARQLKVTKREIVGNVVNIDHYGNLITNISRDEFEKIIEINGNGVSYTVRIGREVFNQINSYYTDVESGDCFTLFNSNGVLQIGINKGSASQLLGLGIDAPVIIEFSN